MLGSLLRIATDVTLTAVAVTEPLVDVAVETVKTADEIVVSPVADVVSDVCQSTRDSIS